MSRPALYPKDLTMSLESNHIQDEVRIFDTIASRIFVPNGGCFYTRSLVMKDNNGRLLQPNIDFAVLYLHEEATLESNENVASVIQILKESIPQVTMEYRVIGGEYGNTVYGILKELENITNLKRNVDWEVNVYNKPEVYPPAPHFHRAQDFKDWDKVWIQLEGIRKAIIFGDSASWQSVYTYIERLMKRSLEDGLQAHIHHPNAHGKHQVGLSNVENYGVATLEDVKNKSPDKYITAAVLQEGMEEAGFFSEKFKVYTYKEGEYIYYVIRSNDLFSTRQIDYNFTEAAGSVGSSSKTPSASTSGSSSSTSASGTASTPADSKPKPEFGILPVTKVSSLGAVIGAFDANNNLVHDVNARGVLTMKLYKHEPSDLSMHSKAYLDRIKSLQAISTYTETVNLNKALTVFEPVSVNNHVEPFKKYLMWYQLIVDGKEYNTVLKFDSQHRTTGDNPTASIRIDKETYMDKVRTQKQFTHTSLLPNIPLHEYHPKTDIEPELVYTGTKYDLYVTNTSYDHAYKLIAKYKNGRNVNKHAILYNKDETGDVIGGWKIHAYNKLDTHFLNDRFRPFIGIIQYDILNEDGSVDESLFYKQFVKRREGVEPYSLKGYTPRPKIEDLTKPGDIESYRNGPPPVSGTSGNVQGDITSSLP